MYKVVLYESFKLGVFTSAKVIFKEDVWLKSLIQMGETNHTEIT